MVKLNQFTLIELITLLTAITAFIKHIERFLDIVRAVWGWLKKAWMWARCRSVVQSSLVCFGVNAKKKSSATIMKRRRYKSICDIQIRDCDNSSIDVDIDVDLGEIDILSVNVEFTSTKSR